MESENLNVGTSEMSETTSQLSEVQPMEVVESETSKTPSVQPSPTHPVVESGDSSLASASNVWTDLITHCVFCKRDFKEIARPKLLPCLHNACPDCISSDKAELKCLQCQQLFQAPEAIDNYFFPLSNVGEGINDKNGSEDAACCTNCEDNAVASAFCTDCGEWLCNACVNAHQRVKLTKDHVVRPKNEIPSTVRRALYCPTHPRELLKMFCKTCDRLTCRDCQLAPEHRDHSYEFVAEAGARERKTFDALVVDVHKKRKYLETSIKLSEIRQSEIDRCEQLLQEDIKNFVSRFISEINQRGHAHMKRLHNMCGTLKEELKKSHCEMSECLQKLDHAKRFAEIAMNQDEDPALLVHAKRIIHNQLQNVIKTEVHVPNPELLMEFRFHEDPRCLNIIKQTGYIMLNMQQPGTRKVDDQQKPDSQSKPRESINLPPGVQPAIVAGPVLMAPLQPNMTVQSPQMQQQTTSQQSQILQQQQQQQQQKLQQMSANPNIQHLQQRLQQNVQQQQQQQRFHQQPQQSSQFNSSNSQVMSSIMSNQGISVRQPQRSHQY